MAEGARDVVVGEAGLEVPVREGAPEVVGAARLDARALAGGLEVAPVLAPGAEEPITLPLAVGPRELDQLAARWEQHRDVTIARLVLLAAHVDEPRGAVVVEPLAAFGGGDLRARADHQRDPGGAVRRELAQQLLRFGEGEGAGSRHVVGAEVARHEVVEVTRPEARIARDLQGDAEGGHLLHDRVFAHALRASLVHEAVCGRDVVARDE
ncbi:MAG: hypothetical protein Q8S73_09180 [Deltaproteobacteria bacterium]|nr:hypothetical protein [Deltaproteobacteria bacterium]